LVRRGKNRGQKGRVWDIATGLGCLTLPGSPISANECSILSVAPDQTMGLSYLFHTHTHTHTTNLRTAWSYIKYHHQLSAHPYSQAALSSSLVHQEGNSTSASGPLHGLTVYDLVLLRHATLQGRKWEGQEVNSFAQIQTARK